LREIPQIESIGEKPLTKGVAPSLLKKAAAVPKGRNQA
jgi:hypothetical protein